MKNKLCYVLFGLLLIFSCINNVFAAEITVSAKADKESVIEGEEVSILVNLKSDVVIRECLISIETPDGIDNQTITPIVNTWVAEESGIRGILVKNSAWTSNSATAPTNGENIMKVSYKVNNSGKVVVKTDHCATNTNNEKLTYQDVSVDLKVKDLAEDTTLSSLTVTGGTMPTFDPNKTDNYIIELDSPTFSLSMKATNPDYDDDIVVKDENGDTLNPSSITFKNISSNLMPMTITVNGKTTYSLVAHYEAKTEDLDNSLASLKINGTNISLTGTTLSHTVGSAVNKIKVEYTLKDSEKFEIDKDLSNLSGEEVTMNEDGIAHVIIVVKPKDSTVGGTSKTYTITVKKEGTAVVPEPEGPDEDDDPSYYEPSDNPTTGDISMFIMSFILIASLVCSIILYQRNLESYK